MTDKSLQQGLKNRHVGMIAIGGVIGAGLFGGSGAGIPGTGPAILVSYGIAGLLVILVMRMLGEMSAASPDTGSFSAYADRAIGRWAGFTIGWLYWWFWAEVLAVEATAGAKIVHGWIPALPQWALALVLMVLLTATTLFSVGSYGEFEFWFSTIKVAAIGVFIVLGVLAIFGLLPGTHSVGASNLTGHGGFFPRGYGAVVTGLLTVVFAIMGRAIVSIAVVITRLPWNAGDVATSPYVAVLDNIGISGAGTIMDVIVLTAVLSCLNSGLYTASRMAFSLAGRGDAPKAFSSTNKRGVPYVAIWVSVSFGFLAVIFYYTSPDTVFLFLLNGSGAVALFVWAVNAVSQLRMRHRLERDAPERILVRMWLYPYLTVATIAGIAAVLVVMLFDDDGRPQVLWSMAVAAVVLIAAFVRHGRSRATEPISHEPLPA